ncbi:MFS transporter [Achromobacter anxifer]|jgi:predicted MFS family arabinose efflux permease|uniref:Purine ribonucleoside efflux pump NepI n=1 Tax=Achromobacter anxifer TaxID=1287737 RepID=A0A6S7E6I3_9BURK|nr:MFS transporter [Achromobacter anxifer]MDF8361519.1 MFS transporter [Achromobacter anxifer]CAB3898711.1 Purine ribonucleoside efflux pump NepI [Achromobacter anxifer]
MTRGTSLQDQASAGLPVPEPAAGRAGWRAWLGVTAAGMATFCVVTTEMLPVGLFVPITGELDVSVGMGGFMLFVPAILAALFAPLVVLGARGADRRLILCGLLALLAGANAASAWAPSMPWFLAARILVGFCIGGVWAIAGGLAGRLVAPGGVGLATSIIFGGVAVASVAGVPLGAFIGELAGWRAAFGAMAALCAGVLLLNLCSLPALPAARSLRPRQLLSQLANPGLRLGLTVTLFLVAGHFMAYTFVRPLLQIHAAFGDGWIGPLLFAYGAAGVAGNFLGGGAAARRPAATLLTIAASLSLILLLLGGLGRFQPAAIALLLCWGLAYGAVSVSLQTWMMKAAPDAVEAATALFVAVFNLGIAAGSLLGVPSVDALGVRANLWLAAACMLWPAALLARAGWAEWRKG